MIEASASFASVCLLLAKFLWTEFNESLGTEKNLKKD